MSLYTDSKNSFERLEDRLEACRDTPDTLEVEASRLLLFAAKSMTRDHEYRPATKMVDCAHRLLNKAGIP